MKWSDIQAENWDIHKGYVEDRWKDLSEHAHAWSRESLKILFLTNAGGAVAVLAFIGATSTVRAEDWPWTMLAFFCVGIIMLQVFHAAIYYKLEWMWNSYRKDISELFSDIKDWEKVYEDDDARTNRFLWLDLFPIGAGLCFITAVLIGFCNYQNLIEKERANGRVNEQTACTSTNLPEAKPSTGRSAKGEPPKNPTTSPTSEETIKKPAS